VWGGLWVLLAGLLCLVPRWPLGDQLKRASYDLPFYLSLAYPQRVDLSEVEIVFLDVDSHQQLGLRFDQPWDRALHAQLLQRLTADGARAVVFDIVFSDPGVAATADQALAQAIRENGRVLLAAELADDPTAATPMLRTRLTTLTLPYEPFLEAASGWGLPQLQPDDDFIVRQHYHGPRDRDWASLTWAAYRLARPEAPEDPSARWGERWVRYYGQPIPNISYRWAGQAEPGHFRDKIVLIGARPMTGYTGERKDEFRSPFSWGFAPSQFIPAVEIHATILLNLLRGDWLRRVPPVLEYGVLALAAAAFGYGLFVFRPRAAAGIAVVGLVGVAGGAVVGFSMLRLWFPWLIVVAVHIPVGLLWRVLSESVEWYRARRQLEAARRADEARIREQAALLDEAQDAILVHDLTGRVQYWNRSAERLYGWASQEVLGQPVPEGLLEADLPRRAQLRRDLLATGAWVGELRQKTRAGQPLTVASRWTLVRDAAQEPKSVFVINTDATQVKKLEAQFLRAQRMESIGTLAGGVAHDLNNVLTPVLMTAQLLQLNPLPPDSQRMLEIIEASAKRGADMVRQILAFARGRDGEQSVVQLTHLIKEMDKFLRETLPKSIRVVTHLETQLPPVKADATQVHQALLNLCVNARDAMPEGGQISIRAGRVTLEQALAMRGLEAAPGDHVVITVSDTGTGIPEEIVERIFEPFFTTKAAGKGTGLGLATVVKVMKSHRGVVEVKSQPGQGTAFQLYFPAVPVTVALQAEGLLSEDQLGQGELVLVVDDEAAVCDLVKGTLEAHGYEALTVQDPTEVVWTFLQHEHKVALLLTDLMMPAMGGQAVLQSLRRFRPNLRCVAMSGVLDKADLKAELQSQGVALLAKPFTAGHLLEAVHAALHDSPNSKLPESRPVEAFA